MRRILATVALVACGGNKPVSNPAAEKLHLQPPDAVVLDSLITRNVVSIMRTQPDYFFPLHWFVREVDRGASCGLTLQQKLGATYHLNVPNVDGRGMNQYYILEGLEQDEVLRCMASAMKDVRVVREGELLAISKSDGSTIYAAWKGPFVVVGARDLVNGALHSSPVPRWHDMLAGVAPNVPIWWGSSDGVFTSLFGVSTVHYEVAIERLETTPNSYFAGRAVATYHSAGDAAIVARRIKEGEVQLPKASPEIAEAFKRLKVKQNGPTVVIGFDLGMFGGISAETLAEMEKLLREAEQQR